MTQLNQRFSKLAEIARSLDEQVVDFVEQIENFAKDLEKKLNNRRKKYTVEVRLEEQFDFRDYRLDFFITAKDGLIHYVFTMSVTDDFDEDEILKSLDDYLRDELSQKGKTMLNQTVFIMTLELIKNCELDDSPEAERLRLANLDVLSDIVGDEVLDEFKCKRYRSQIFIEKIDQTFRFRVETFDRNGVRKDLSYFDLLNDAQKHCVFVSVS